MITNKTAAKLAELSAQPITDRLRSTAYEQVVEKFCLPLCGHTPNGGLCKEAEMVHRLVVALLFGAHSELN
ncbi:hypothetical protein ES708_30219 [subsurface metagenome]